MDKHVYIIGGLGATSASLGRLVGTGWNVHPIEWIPPSKSENISEYARRVCSQIHHSKPAIIGVSLGGILALEISKLVPTERLILISTLHGPGNINWLARQITKAFIPVLAFLIKSKRCFRVLCWLLSARTDAQKRLLTSSVDALDFDFLRWAIREVLNCTNLHIPPNAFTIHGTDDRIFPMRQADYPIEGAGHFMVVDRATELSELIGELLMPRQGPAKDRRAAEKIDRSVDDGCDRCMKACAKRPNLQVVSADTKNKQ
jgi:pimeloyl-ACP methyl ester carboxylesterase